MIDNSFRSIFQQIRSIHQHRIIRRKLNRPTGGPQTSYLELNEHPITIDDDGEILEPYGATQFGYFSFIQLGNATPRQYRPEDYSIAGNE